MSKKISKAKMNKAIKEHKFEKKTISICDDVEITVDPCATPEARSNAIVIGMGFVWGKNGTEYKPGLESFAYNYAVIKCFTDIDMSDIEVLLNLINNTNIPEIIINSMPEEVIHRFNADYRSMYERFVELGKTNTPINRLADKLMSIVEKVNDNIPDVSQEEMKSAIDVLGKISKISDKDIVKAIAENGEK